MKGTPNLENGHEKHVEHAHGLTESEAQEKLEKHGKNIIVKEKKKNIAIAFLEKFFEPLILLLIASAIISFLIGEKIDAIAILIAVSLVAILSFAQEYRAEKALGALKKLSSPKARVIREGKIREINAENIVIGDVIVLEAGDKVPADAKIFESYALRVDESLLTGESFPEEKEADAKDKKKSVVFAGSTIVNGRGKAVVIATGKKTELGKIAESIEKAEEEKTPLQQRLSILGRQLSALAIFVSILIFIFGAYHGIRLLELFKVAVSLAVAAIPEGLPIAITITLALGAKKLAKENAIAKSLSAVETLGSTEIICSDKTGTLTENKLVVSEMVCFNNEKEACESMILSSLAYTSYSNDEVERAIYEYAKNRASVDKEIKLLSEIPFDHDRKVSGAEYEIEGERKIFIKGAVEAVLKLCSLGNKEREKIEEKERNLAEKGLKVICIAAGSSFSSLKPISLVAFKDPIRESVKEAVKKCEKAGIKVAMVTGDKQETAIAIARELGIYDEKEENKSAAISGEELERMSYEELESIITKVAVFYRTMPNQKMKIVKALKDLDKVVAMTGDGINDAPALKVADIGVAMGKRGADVAREAGDLILIDDNFKTIVRAIEEGRKIYKNIKNFIRFELTTSIAAVLTIALAMFLAPFLGIPASNALILNAIQILWINIIMDGPPAQTLAMESSYPGIMREKPIKRQEKILNRELLSVIIFNSSVMLLITLSVFFATVEQGFTHARTLAFSTFVFLQLFNAFNSRSLEKSIFELGIFSNRYLILAVLASFALQLMIIYIPVLQKIFGTTSLALSELIFVILISSLILFIDEARKWILKKKKKKY